MKNENLENKVPIEINGEEQNAYLLGILAFHEFDKEPQANFPNCPYEKFPELEKYWILGWVFELADKEILVCEECGSKDVTVSETTFYDINTREEVGNPWTFNHTESHCCNCDNDDYCDLSEFLDEFLESK